MVTRFSPAVTRPNSASTRCTTKLRPYHVGALTLMLCSVLPIGCQSTRLNSRSDNLSAHLSDQEEEERNDAAANKGLLGSLFTRWWPTDPQDEAYDLGMPGVEEDYVKSATENSGKNGGLSKPSSPAEKKKNQFARKSTQDPTEMDEGLNPEQKELYRRQMEAMRRLGLDKDDLSEILADDTANGDLLDGIVQLPPIPSKNAAASEDSDNSEMMSDRQALSPVVATKTEQAEPIANAGSRFKLSDDSPPPTPPAIANLPPAPPSSTPLASHQTQPAQPSTAGLLTPPISPEPVPANMATPTNTPNPSGNTLVATLPQPTASSPVQSASGTSHASDTGSQLAGPYFENDAQKPLATSWENDTRQAINKLQERLSQDKNLTSKERLNLEARLRLIQLAANDMDAAMSPSQGWNKDAEQWFRSTLFSVHEAIALTGPESPNQRYSLVAKHHRDASQHLLSLSDLEVSNVAFCTEVLSYGQVKKFPANALTANEEIILYCEFNNFAALKVHDGFETEFEARYEIVDLQNNRIYEEKLPTDRQTSANRRRDYFIAYQMYLPKDIAPGHYRLKLHVKDVKAGKFGQGLVDFQIVK